MMAGVNRSDLVSQALLIVLNQQTTGPHVLHDDDFPAKINVMRKDILSHQGRTFKRATNVLKREIPKTPETMEETPTTSPQISSLTDSRIEQNATRFIDMLLALFEKEHGPLIPPTSSDTTNKSKVCRYVNQINTLHLNLSAHY
jgi:hypothetical protein